ncbi:unnamed protein product [marine sediment metagenome]|uniref:Uncharacterized protein n=1 Tax=marine sediment metagenome TaxID=412755 RepID=X1ATC9_9ZZZZ
MGKKKGFINQAKIFSLLRTGALAMPAVLIATTPGLTNEQKIQRGITHYTGWHFQRQKWDFEEMKKGWMPFVGASLATIGIPKILSMIRRF